MTSVIETYRESENVLFVTVVPPRRLATDVYAL
jgi:hypothetical protein